MPVKVGDKSEKKRVVSMRDIEDFARLSGDENPLHLDTEFAKRSIFGSRIAHGFLVGSLISAVIGQQLPGPGTIYLSQYLKFLKPVFPGDEIKAIVEVIQIREEKGIYTLKTYCQNQNGDIVIEGEAVVAKPPQQ